MSIPRSTALARPTPGAPPPTSSWPAPSGAIISAALWNTDTSGVIPSASKYFLPTAIQRPASLAELRSPIFTVVGATGLDGAAGWGLGLPAAPPLEAVPARGAPVGGAQA